MEIAITSLNAEYHHTTTRVHFPLHIRQPHSNTTFLYIIFIEFVLIFSFFRRNVPPEFLDGMGSYCQQASICYQQRPHDATFSSAIVTQPQPSSEITTISCSQLDAKSTVEALIHQPILNSIQSRKDHVLSICTQNNKPYVVQCARHACMQVSSGFRLKSSASFDTFGSKIDKQPSSN